MEPHVIPDSVSYERLLSAIASRSIDHNDEYASVYFIQLQQRLTILNSQQKRQFAMWQRKIESGNRPV
jgi:hypothetical protein